jgi:hypothetical protein
VQFAHFHVPCVGWLFWIVKLSAMFTTRKHL